MKYSRSVHPALPCLSALAMVLSSVALPSSATAEDNLLGQALYTEACASCHGVAGKGDGEFAQHLNVPPPNLTQLASAESDGEFPFLDVFMVVDGRTGVDGHGSRDMPIWGRVFQRDVGDSGGPYGAELLIRAKLVALTDYVASLQQE